MTMEENSAFSVDKVEHYFQMMGEMALGFGTKLLLAIIVWIIGAWIIRRIVNLVDLAMTKKKVEVTLHQFLLSFINILFKNLLAYFNFTLQPILSALLNANTILFHSSMQQLLSLDSFVSFRCCMKATHQAWQSLPPSKSSCLRLYKHFERAEVL